MVDQKQEQKDLMAWLTDISEGAIQRIAEAPGADRVLQALKGLGDRVDDLQRRTKGFEELEKRLTKLEKRVDGLAKAKSSASRSPKGDSASEKA